MKPLPISLLILFCRRSRSLLILLRRSCGQQGKMLSATMELKQIQVSGRRKELLFLVPDAVETACRHQMKSVKRSGGGQLKPSFQATQGSTAGQCAEPEVRHSRRTSD
ncbi:hypothetical protein [Rhodopila sp.]|uniref:hypothetical protein n=1 Tax=Rhodopila sp. TaxID=2480087 RepID=UPI003D13DCAD